MAKQRRGNLVELTYEALRRKIIQRELKPGEILDEKILMQQLNVGRTPLRQAILLLKNDHFIEGRPNKSSYVRDFSVDEVKELYETLAILEKNVAFLAAKRITAAELKEIEALEARLDSTIDAAKNATAPQDLERIGWEITDLNFGFHDLISQACKNRLLASAHRQMRLQAERFSYITFARQMDADPDKHGYNTTIATHHHRMIACLQQRDASGIVSIAIEHVMFFQSQIFQSMLDISYA